MRDKMSKSEIPLSRRAPRRPVEISQNKWWNVWQRLSPDGKVATVIGIIGLVLAFFALVPGPWHPSGHESGAVSPVKDPQPKQTQPQEKSPDDSEPKPKLKYVPLPNPAPSVGDGQLVGLLGKKKGNPASTIDFNGGKVAVWSATEAFKHLQDGGAGRAYVYDGDVSGGFELYVDIAKSGAVQDIQVVSGDEKLAEQAKEAVKQWKFRPFIENGEPVSAQRVIVFGKSSGG
jgi:hypothetical protein